MTPPSRRTYIKAIGTVTVAGGLAGCSSNTDEGDTEDNQTTDNGNTSSGGDDSLTAVVPGTAPGFAPFEMNRGGELVGFDIDLLSAVAEEGGIELVEWNTFEFASLIPALQDNRIDVIAAGMTITEDRQQQVDFSDPYYNSNQSVLVQSGGEFQPESLSDLEGRAVGAQTGTTGERVVNNQLIDQGIISEGQYEAFDNYVFAVEDLERGLIDAIVIDEPVAQTFVANRDVEIAFVYETGEQFGFAVRQDDDELRAALNDGLAAVEESGQLEELTTKWFQQE